MKPFREPKTVLGTSTAFSVVTHPFFSPIMFFILQVLQIFLHSLEVFQVPMAMPQLNIILVQLSQEEGGLCSFLLQQALFQLKVRFLGLFE